MKIFPVYLWTGNNVRTLYRAEVRVGRVGASVIANSHAEALVRALKEIMRPY